jgi:diguanylate cyclase (GGDEF)-like protein/PAS domain S-box-containing protein
MRKTAGIGTIPIKLYLLILAFLLSIGLASWFQEPAAWGFSGFTFLLTLIFISRYAWFTQAKEQTPALEYKTMEQWLMGNRMVFDSLFMHNPNVVCLIDANGMITKANGNTEQIIGFSKQELENRQFQTLLSPETLEGTKHIFDNAHQGNPQTSLMAVLHKDGYRVDLNATAAPIKEGSEILGIILIGQDITAAMRTEERIRHLAYYDDMTGLPNRRLFIKNLQEAIVSSRQNDRLLAVFYLDIDRFKIINDSFGHDYGDMLLLQLAERFSRCISEHDFLARTEGDEFALFFSGVNHPDQVDKMAQRIYSVLEEPFSLEQYQLHITASIGIAILSEEEEDADSLTKYADIALTLAKEKGKSDYRVFNSDMKTVSLQRLTLESELRKALQHNELLLHFQPQMDIESGDIVGFEALVRWNHPERGMIPPKDFIPFAEESGLIVPIGEWVMLEACRQNKLWQEQGYTHVPVSVNLSTRQFLQHNLRELVADVLRTTGLDPAYLELEITESSTLDVEYAIEILLELKTLGVKISIDDFGTGYSSLSYLKRFPIDKLKIDQSFVRDIMTDPNDAAIVASIISMTRHMNLKVIAEGVETEEQLRFLQTNNCDEIQGYWFSPPLHPQQAEELMLRILQAAVSHAE